MRCHAALPALLLALLAAACASKPPAAPPAAGAPPIVAMALLEWDAWGRVVVEGYPVARPPDLATTPERFERLTTYWYNVPGGTAVAQKHEKIRARMMAQRSPGGGGDTPDSAGWEDVGLYANPAWSAAFISYVARRAGIPTWDLPSSSRHASYIDAVLARAAESPDEAAFIPEAPELYAPKPGDLLCADRAYVPLRHWTERLATRGKPRPMHCDVVVATSPGVIEAVGGNVQDMVTLRRLPADAEGHIIQAPAGSAPFMLILAAKAPTS